ncbi:MAG: hypothetical protein QOF10_5599 [Kribbellaceae bacterium]|nr:hypothetical protein [Kribbellaceae bacterium]
MSSRPSQVVVPEWSRGRVVLLGDAGYCGSPLAGHGTALSLVGAYVLAGELAVAEGNHLRAFRRTSGSCRATSSSGRSSRPFRPLLAKLAAEGPDKITLKPYPTLHQSPR